MPQGLQVWDNNGLLIVDTTQSVLNLFGKIDIGQPGTAATGSIVDARFQYVVDAKARLMTFLTPTIDASDLLFARPTILLSGHTLSWSWNTTSRFPLTLVYGIY